MNDEEMQFFSLIEFRDNGNEIPITNCLPDDDPNGFTSTRLNQFMNVAYNTTERS